MRTTIDGAGRIVVPKAIRDAMGLTAGRAVDVTFADGRIEIEIAPAKVHVDTSGRLPVIRAEEPMEPLTDEIVRTTLEAVRR
ncbi:AbrB/MazE/SpoVT family DNA-binding domain-containing protein [Tsukamurella sp. PLM1]|uniref:AbrB/MazE/SpoVT family DNA-binding domain-containing protein n=1 Tax=Tsukamurella sp. PLM1 TaxID=2929795 RepID=UPI00204F552F|nr:AbrB/MazE/SpoVT family DNA-binding domain-containing protein [Tsukamurella sp. PLM1]BDH59627.1 hypothetical protein MTP03_45660 [Tsukamurella sp. PLM1]